MIRHPRGRPKAQELPQRQRVRAAPFDPALGVDPLEVADHVHPEVPAGRNRRRAHLRGEAAGRLRENIAAGVDQHPLKPIVEDMARRERGISFHVTTRSPCLSPCRPSAIRPILQTPDQPMGSESVNFVNRLLSLLPLPDSKHDQEVLAV